jgi:hypothetical protein
VLVAIAW